MMKRYRNDNDMGGENDKEFIDNRVTKVEVVTRDEKN